MNQTDDRILEALDESDMLLTPAVLAKNLDYTRTWISNRLQKLLDVGLVENPDKSYYRITELGRAYLAGELDAEDLESTGE